ncbi:respiratory chain complex I subunit 1 family protein [uncultured Methanofollis sp.]|uniref:respiratory chain complex I subunit 1 family protein n=1 Tax=uncultured Methanofollis sp. TaxID=262500 RepID=UPI00261D57C5|nr:complex I subunit 1 family protein [uncultured Methanofollis sp.]
MISVLTAVLYLLLAPIAGGFIAGIDRKLTARMQGRVGPPVLQPFYDVAKLFEKEDVTVTPSQNFYILSYLVFMAVTGAIFFAGGDLLLVLFAFTLAHVFIVLGAYAAYSPYSYVGAERELITLMAYEPMIILTAVGLYLVTGSFYVSEIAASEVPAALYLPGVLIGFLTVLTIKLRKSPFDISTSHHAHQELVKGLTTEFSGPTLAKIEIAHWYETVVLLGIVYLFFGFNPLLALVAIAVTYFLEVFIDNTFSRMKWQWTMKEGWGVAVTLGFINLAVLYYFYLGV